MEAHLFTYEAFTLEYHVYGHGSKHLLYFHGFGKNAREFLDYDLSLNDTYTVYSFSLFHHGKSVYPVNRVDRNTLEPAELVNMFTAFLREKNIHRFSLMGYSMGGKIALLLLQYLAERVDALVLVAPDGIKRNFWYRFTSQNRLGNAVYRGIIRNPRFFFFTIKSLRKTRLLNQHLYDFVFHHLENEEKRKQVYRVWMTLRHIDPNIKQIVKLIQKYKTRTCMCLGDTTG